MRLDCQILLKPPPLNLLAISDPGNNILLRFIAALKACAVACTVNAGFPSIVMQL